MMQTILSLTIVAATSGWMVWRALRPSLAKAPASKGCACGKPRGSCHD